MVAVVATVAAVAAVTSAAVVVARTAVVAAIRIANPVSEGCRKVQSSNFNCKARPEIPGGFCFPKHGAVCSPLARSSCSAEAR